MSGLARPPQHIRVQNYQQVADAVLHLHSIGKWGPRWVIITALYQAQKCLIAISGDGTAGAEIEFEAQQRVPVAELHLANAALDLVFKKSRNIGYTLDTQQGPVTLGLGLGMVHVPLVRKPRFEPFENRMRWGDKGPSTYVEVGSAKRSGVYTSDRVVAGKPQFVQVEIA